MEHRANRRSARKPLRVRTPKAASRQGARRQGITIVESTMAIAVLMIGTLGFGRVVVEAAAVTRTQDEVDRARAAAGSMLETLQQVELRQVYALFNEDPSDDPEGEATAPGPFFGIAGLELGAQGVARGEVIFPAVEDGAGGFTLREDLDMPELGLPLDLNADGLIDAADRSGDYQLLPVLVRVSWTSASGPAQVELRTLLAGY